MYEQQKAQKARFIGWGIGIVLVVVMVVAKLVLKF
jgi:tetrahydromethanopterin S-methyltransferase subunit F